MSRLIFQKFRSAGRFNMKLNCRNYVKSSTSCGQIPEAIAKPDAGKNQGLFPVPSRRNPLNFTENNLPHRIFNQREIITAKPVAPSKPASRKLSILLLSSAYNGMTQRIEGELLGLGHKVSFQVAESAHAMRQAEDHIRPDLIICPTLMTAIPNDIYTRVKCLIVHPGIKGDRGPSSLDWAILNRKAEWGVTLLEANEEMDAGNIWTSSTFPVPENMSKTGLYNSCVVGTAAKLVVECVDKYLDLNFKPEPLDYAKPNVKGQLHETIKQSHSNRIADFKNDSSEDILRKMLAADSQPGLKATFRIHGEELTRFLYGGQNESTLNSGLSFEPGTVIARRDEAICIASKDGAIWVSQFRSPKSASFSIKPFKFPATLQLGNAALSIPCVPADKLVQAPNKNTFQEISFHRKGSVGFLSFNFYNGAMSTAQCYRLLKVIREIGLYKDLEALILTGSPTSWSNGIHLGQIQGSSDPAAEAYANIRAINEVVKSILSLTRLVTISAIQANAGAGGVYLGLATDFSFARPGIVFNPHYKNMGLYGSELHTYLTRGRISSTKLCELKESARPLLSQDAVQIGLIDSLEQDVSLNHLKLEQGSFLEQVHQFTQQLISNREMLLQNTDMKRAIFEQDAELRQFCEEHELNEMYLDIFDNRNNFAERRESFLAKTPFKNQDCSRIAVSI